MASQWFYTQNGEKFGPYSSKEFKALAVSGKVGPSDLVWKEGLSHWVAAGRIKGMFDSAADAKAPKPARPVAPTPVAMPEEQAVAVMAPPAEETPAEGTPDSTPWEQGNAAAAPPAQQGNGVALASLIMGLLLCLAPFTSILAIIFGAMGMRRSNLPSVNGKGKGLAIAGLVLGCVGIVFSVLSVAVLLPSLSRARETAYRIRSQANLLQIGTGSVLYSNDRRGAYPPDLGTLVNGHYVDFAACFSPAAGKANPPKNVADEAAYVNANADYVYLGAGKNTTLKPTAVLAYEKPHVRQNAGGNVLFGDGHVEWESVEQIEQRLAQQGKTLQR